MNTWTKFGLILAQLWLMSGVMACLNETDIEAINAIANYTNISNITLIDIFNKSCYYCSGDIATLSSNITIIKSNLDSNISSIGTDITELNSMVHSASVALTNGDSILNLTIYSEDSKLEARLNTKYEQYIRNLISNTSFNMSMDWTSNYSKAFDLYVSSNFTMLQKMFEQMEKSAYEKLATKYDLNQTQDSMDDQAEKLNYRMDIEMSNMKWWVGVAAFAVIIIILFINYKRIKYPKVMSNVRFIPSIKTPTALEDESELETKSEIREIRKFIFDTDFSGAAKADAYKRFLNGEMDTKEDLEDHMKLFDIEKKVKKSAKT